MFDTLSAIELYNFFYTNFQFIVSQIGPPDSPFNCSLSDDMNRISCLPSLDPIGDQKFVAMIFNNNEVEKLVTSLEQNGPIFNVDFLKPNTSYWVEIFSKNTYGYSKKEVIRFTTKRLESSKLSCNLIQIPSEIKIFSLPIIIRSRIIFIFQWTKFFLYLYLCGAFTINYHRYICNTFHSFTKAIHNQNYWTSVSKNFAKIFFQPKILINHIEEGSTSASNHEPLTFSNKLNRFDLL